MNSLCLRETFNQLDTGTEWRAVVGDGSDNKEVAHPQIRAQCTLNEVVEAAEAVEGSRGGRVFVATTLAWICWQVH